MKAFVIMPYGNDTPEMKKENNKIFRFLISAAVDTYDHGAEVIRQDMSGEGGHILGNVIQNLSDSDIVIADLSGLNWNVAYELGIRHSLVKWGTVLLCNTETKLPFDISGFNIITYSRETWMDDIDELTERIVQAISNAVKTRRCDSPVHNELSFLPESVTRAVNSDTNEAQNRIAELSAQNGILYEEIEKLHQRLEDAGLNSKESGDRQTGLMEAFTAAVKNIELISDKAVDHLRELEQEKKYEEFAQFLARVLEEGYLDETDCHNVYVICKRLDVPELTKRYIEVAVSFYPDNEELQGFLANVYSTDYRQKERALSIVNDMLGVKRIGGKFELASKVRTERMLNSFFDVYLHLKKYAELIEIGKLLLQSNPSLSVRIARNIADACIHLEKYDMALAACGLALRTDPLSDMMHFQMFQYHRRRNEINLAYQELENAICCDKTDTDYYFMIAGYICDEGIARTKSGVVEKIDVRNKAACVLPFIVQALIYDPIEIERAITFLKKNKLSACVSDFVERLSSADSVEEAFADIDMYAVNYCYNKEDEIIARVQELPDNFDDYMN